MKDFKHYLDKTGEVGYVEEVAGPIVYVRGIPQAKPSELIIFETGVMGQVLGLGDLVEVLLFSKSEVGIETRVARTGELLQLSLSEKLLGHRLDALGRPVETGLALEKIETRSLDAPPTKILKRKEIDQPLETGVSQVDLIVPLAKGQRELIVGDNNTGKTSFLLQVAVNQARQGTVCVYASIGKKRASIRRLWEFFQKKGIDKNVVLVASSSSEASGMVFLTPYTAMTIAEYFKDKGKDVLVILDDMTNHAKYYREISLLARRFPGRSSYPGDIFFVHSRLLERAGNFDQASITCLPVAESIMGDLTGYIQTNLMSMTDGHIYFDSDLIGIGRFPAVNPFLSVTRVGLQVQTKLLRDISRELLGFLVHLTRIRQYMHFGAELSDTVNRTLERGERLDVFFDQASDLIIPININAFLLANLWAGYWREVEPDKMKEAMLKLIEAYKKDKAFQKQVDELIGKVESFSQLVDLVKLKDELVTEKLKVQSEKSKVAVKN